MARTYSAFLLTGLCLYLFVGCNSQSSPDSKAKASTARRGVILLRYNPGSESTEQRERGFLETIAKEFPDIPVLSSDQYSGTTPESSLEKAQQMLLKYGDEVAGVFAVCEPNAMGMLGALEEAGLAGTVKFVGFDPSPRMVEALREKKMHGIVLQDPVQMGYLSVKTMVAHLEGKAVEKRVSTGEYVATPVNCQDENMAKLLSPVQFAESDFPPISDPRYRIAVIPKGTTHEFWKSVHAGAARAASEAGNVEILWKGPLQENDREGQINVVQDFTTKKVTGIVLAPLDAEALIAAVKDAKQDGIPTVIFDSGLNNADAIVSYVATDNYQGGVLAARCLAEAIQESAKP